MNNKIIGLFMVMLLSLTLVSALDFDNIKSYNEDLNEVTITNAFGLGEEILSAERLTPNIVKVIDRGKGVLQKVAELKFNTLNKDYELKEIFSSMEFYDTQEDMKEVNRDYVYKYRVKVGERNISQDYSICNEEDFEKCELIKRDPKIEPIYEWREFNTLEELPKDLVIGIFVDVKPNEIVDWKPTLAGKEVAEWSIYDTTADNLISYYQMEGDATDIVGTASGTIVGTPTNSTGKHLASVEFDGNDEGYLVPHGTGAFQFNGTNEFTINLWAKLDVITDKQYIISRWSTPRDFIFRQEGDAGGFWQFYTDTSGGVVNVISNKLAPANTWQMWDVLLLMVQLCLYIKMEQK